VRKEWFGLGLILVIAGLLLLGFSNTPVYGDSYLQRGSLDNSLIYPGVPKVSVLGYFEAGQRFLFNFTKGRFWGVKYDIDNGGLEPGFDVNADVSIPQHKILTFAIYTPSSDDFIVEVYLVSGTSPFMVVYDNQSADFVPLDGGNLTSNAAMEGTINRTGNYSVEATALVPPALQDVGHYYGVAQDPPETMVLWSIEAVATRPYFVSSVSVGAMLILIGTGCSAWAGISKKPSKHLRKTRRQK